MDLHANTLLHMELDLELHSDSKEAVLIKHALDALVPREFLLQKNFFLQPGQKVNLSYDFMLGHDVSKFECRLFAHMKKEQEASLIIHNARIDIIPNSQISPGLHNQKFYSPPPNKNKELEQ